MEAFLVIERKLFFQFNENVKHSVTFFFFILFFILCKKIVDQFKFIIRLTNTNAFIVQDYKHSTSKFSTYLKERKEIKKRIFIKVFDYKALLKY